MHGFVGRATDSGRHRRGLHLDQVWAAYPDAVETTQRISPDIHYIGVDTIFFSHREPSTAISVVTVTNAEQPPYEVCG